MERRVEYKKISYEKGKAVETVIKGTFECWSQNYEEFESGIGIYPCAIIVDDSGQVDCVYAGEVKFINNINKNWMDEKYLISEGGVSHGIKCEQNKEQRKI